MSYRPAIAYRTKCGKTLHVRCYSLLASELSESRAFGYTPSLIQEEILRHDECRKGETCHYCGTPVQPERITVKCAKEICRKRYGRLPRMGYEMEIESGIYPTVIIGLNGEEIRGNWGYTIWLQNNGGRFRVWLHHTDSLFPCNDSPRVHRG